MTAVALAALVPGGTRAESEPGFVWSIVAVSDQPAEGAEIAFDPDGQVFGTTGCNRLTGTATQDGTTLTFGPLATTNMACPDSRMAQEDAILGLLAAPLTVIVDLLRDQATLTSANGETLRLQRTLE